MRSVETPTQFVISLQALINTMQHITIKYKKMALKKINYDQNSKKCSKTIKVTLKKININDQQVSE